MTKNSKKTSKSQSLEQRPKDDFENKSLVDEQSVLNKMKNNRDTEVIYIKTTTENFRRKYTTISKFWRNLKNGLYSINGVSNRKYFKNISGFYFQLENKQNFEILIIYDTSIKKLNRLQVGVRIKKLLGLHVDIKMGKIDEFETIINEMMGISRKFQPFGNCYNNNGLLNQIL